MHHAEHRLGIKAGGTTADGVFTLRARRVPGGVHRGAVPAGELPLPLPRHARAARSARRRPRCRPPRRRDPAARHGGPVRQHIPADRAVGAVDPDDVNRRTGVDAGPEPTGGRIMSRPPPIPGRPGFVAGRPPEDRHLALPVRRLVHARALPRHRWLRGLASRARQVAGRGARRGQERHLARPRRRRLPGRREVGAHAAERVAALPRRQRRRERARHLQGPPADGVRSAPAHRGLPHRLLRRRAVAVLPLHPRRDGARPGAHRRRRSTRPTPPATSARTSSAPTSASTSCCTGAPAPTWSARRRR